MAKKKESSEAPVTKVLTPPSPAPPPAKPRARHGRQPKEMNIVELVYPSRSVSPGQQHGWFDLPGVGTYTAGLLHDDAGRTLACCADCEGDTFEITDKIIFCNKCGIPDSVSAANPGRHIGTLDLATGKARIDKWPDQSRLFDGRAIKGVAVAIATTVRVKLPKPADPLAPELPFPDPTEDDEERMSDDGAPEYDAAEPPTDDRA